MSPDVETLRSWLEKRQPLFIHELVELLKIPSISTDALFKPSIIEAHNWLCTYLSRMGFQVESLATSKYPVILASIKRSEDLPHVLIYNHYDVQPVDPLNLWTHPPFEPYIDETGEIYARGAQDNKGQLWGVLQGLQALLAHGPLPCNVTLCIEGEEECGSHGLRGILPLIQDKLRADALFVVDVDIPARDRPAVTLGVRGNITMTLELTGSNGDLHSGMHGGIVYNPNHAMVEILASLRDPATGCVLVPGFYDDVAMPTRDQLDELSLQFDPLAYEKSHGAKPTGGEKAFTPLESAWLRPTLEINGLSGGYAGEGFKTVIPAKCIAKLSCRLVPNQDSDALLERVKTHILSLVPDGIEVKITVHGGGHWARVDSHGKSALAIHRAYEEVFHKPCERIMTGGSVPIIASMAKLSGSDAIFFGCGLPDDNLHAPNEHYSISRLIDLACVVARSLQLLAFDAQEKRVT